MEIWKDIPGYEGSYQASTKGKIRGLNRICLSKNGSFRTVSNKILTPKIDRYGYYELHLSLKNIRIHFKIHILIAKTFISNPKNKPQVNHKDGNKLNNKISNLEWNTNSENILHAFKNGLMKNNNFINNPARIKCKQFNLDGSFIKEWNSLTEAANFYGIDNTNIVRCCKGNRKTSKNFIWSYV